MADASTIRALVDSTQDMLCIADAGGCFTFVNATWTRVLGWEPDELIGAAYLDFVHPDDVVATAKTAGSAAASVVEGFVNRFRTRDGCYRDLRWWSTPGPSGLICWTVRDVTEYQRFSSRAAEIEAVSGVGSWEVYLETRTVYWSRAARRMIGWTAEREPTLHEALQTVDPESRPALEAAFRDLIERGDSFDIELWRRRIDGGRFPARVTGAAEMRGDKVVRVYGSIENITKRRRRVNALAEARAEAELAKDRLWAAIEAIPDAFVVFDQDDRLVICNREYRRTYSGLADHIQPGVHFETLTRAAVERGILPEAIGQEEEWVQKRLEQHRAAHGEVVEHKLPGDRHLQIREQRTANGDTVAIRTDVTELMRHRANLESMVEERTAIIRDQADELAAALEAQKALNAQQSQFVRMANHEFRTPITIIAGAVRRLRRRPDERLSERLDMIDDALTRLERLLEGTLSLAKADAGKVDFTPSEVSFGLYLRAKIESQAQLFESYDIRLGGDDLTSVLIMADTKLLDHVFDNVLHNARKYSPKSSAIEVEARVDGKMIAVDVRDYGIGIAAEELRKVGQRYFRASTAMGTAGTGIGLSVVKELIELLGGRLSVKSEAGEGSTFTLWLPIHRECEVAS